MNTDATGQTNDYRAAFIHHPGRSEALKKRRAALLCIDMQYLDAARGYGLFETPETSGVPQAGQDYYFDRLEKIALPNVRRLQNTFRDLGMEVIHCRICAMTKDGRDRSAGHKRLGLLAAPGSKEAEIVEEVKPIGDEIVLSKTASGVFPATNLHYILQNMDIEVLYLTGVYTNECVETTAREACDRGYFVTIVDDACATISESLHDASISTLKDRYAAVISTDQAVQEIRRAAAPPSTAYWRH